MLEVGSGSPALENLTLLLNRSADGDAAASQVAWNHLQNDIRMLADRIVRRETRIPDLQRTVVMQEVWLRLFSSDLRNEISADEMSEGESETSATWDNRAHFWGAVVQTANRFIIDEYRRANAAKRGGGWKRSSLELVAGELDDISRIGELDIPGLRVAMARLREVAPLTAQVVEHRYLLGMTVRQTAACLGIARRTVDNHWSYGRAWLFEALSKTADHRD